MKILMRNSFMTDEVLVDIRHSAKNIIDLESSEDDTSVDISEQATPRKDGHGANATTNPNQISLNLK